MAKYFGSGIPLSASFDLSGQKPLDARDVVETISERDAMPDMQKYEGMVVYCIATKLSYQLVKNNEGTLEWNTFGTNSDSVIANLAPVATSGSYTDLKNVPATNYVVQDTQPEADSKTLIWVEELN